MLLESNARCAGHRITTAIFDTMHVVGVLENCRMSDQAMDEVVGDRTRHWEFVVDLDVEWSPL